MAHFRRSHIAHVLIVCACSSTDPSAGGSTIEGVDIDAQIDCKNGQNCTEQATEGAALAAGAIWVARVESLCSGNSGCNGGAITQSVAALGARFGTDGGLATLESSDTWSSVAVTSAAVGANRDASAIYFAYDDLKRSAVILDALTPTGGDAGTATVTTNLGTVIGVIGDDGAAIVGIGTPTGQCQASDCVSFDFSGGDQSNTAGDLYRVTQGGGITGHQSTTFDVTFSEHLLAADAASVYWIGGGKLHSAPRDLSAVTDVAPVSGAPVGLDVASAVGWSTVSGSWQTNGPHVFNVTGCQVYVGGNLVYDNRGDTESPCLGLGLDASYAYFALVESRQVSCNSCSGPSYAVFTTGIARVAVGGPASQKPVELPIVTDRMFGPRRFFVDDTYVYGVDPAYVLRVPKTAFGP